jgi:ribonuclease HII
MCDYDIEKCLLKKGYKYICGVDEVGRGAIFGPVVSGAVILNPEKLNFEIKDSKKLSHNKRLGLAKYIYKNSFAFSIGWCWNEEIDVINILEATKKSIKMAVSRLQILPNYVLIDGMKPDFLNIPGEGILRGDNKSLSIAAASIIAKVFRDFLLISFSEYFPEYHLKKNKGYPTLNHISAILSKKITGFHRKSFKIRKCQQIKG